MQRFFLLVVFLGSFTTSLFAGPIIQDKTTASLTFALYSALGVKTTFAQSFTAEDKAISSIGFALADANAFFGGLDFTVTLFQGDGTGGPVLATAARSFTSLPPIDPDRVFFDFDFSATSLSVGQKYTARIENVASQRGAVYDSYFLGDVYPGGRAYYNDVQLSPLGTPDDLVFRVLPASTPVPESASGLLLVPGLGALLVFRWKRMRGHGVGAPSSGININDESQFRCGL